MYELLMLMMMFFVCGVIYDVRYNLRLIVKQLNIANEQKLDENNTYK